MYTVVVAILFVIIGTLAFISVKLFARHKLIADLSQLAGITSIIVLFAVILAGAAPDSTDKRNEILLRRAQINALRADPKTSIETLYNLQEIEASDDREIQNARLGLSNPWLGDAFVNKTTAETKLSGEE